MASAQPPPPVASAISQESRATSKEGQERFARHAAQAGEVQHNVEAHDASKDREGDMKRRQDVNKFMYEKTEDEGLKQRQKALGTMAEVGETETRGVKRDMEVDRFDYDDEFAEAMDAAQRGVGQDQEGIRWAVLQGG